MPPPLHLPYIIGNDICRIARIRRILNGRLSRQFVHRILTTEEIEHATTARILRCVLEGDSQRVTSKEKGKEDVSFTRAIEFMAGRFAAKEAVIKAHPHRRLTFQCIAILRMRFGSQGAVEETTTKDDEEREDEVGEGEKDEDEPRSEPLVAFIKADGRHPDAHATVSISHDTEYATAVCLGVSPAVPLVADAERGSKGRE